MFTFTETLLIALILLVVSVFGYFLGCMIEYFLDRMKSWIKKGMIE